MQGTQFIALTVPIPPPLSACFKNARGAGRVKTERYKTWQRAAENVAMTQRRRAFTGPVSVSMTVARPDRRKRDLDNLLKPSLDFLTHIGVLDDDSQVVDLSIRWGEADGARIEVSQA